MKCISFGMAALFLSGCAQTVNCGCPPEPLPQYAKIVSVGPGLVLDDTTAFGSLYEFTSSTASSTIALKRTNGYAGKIAVSLIDTYGATGDSPCTEVTLGPLTPQLTFTLTAAGTGLCQVSIYAGQVSEDSIEVQAGSPTPPPSASPYP